MNKVITLSDSNYFGSGQLFIKTRHRVKAKFILYGPDLTKEQIKILSDNKINYIEIDKELFETKMQMLKFKLLQDNIDQSDRSGLSFIDFDTAFLKDWEDIFKDDFSLGVTVRNEQRNNIEMSRAYTNGGVIFCKNTKESHDFCQYALDVMYAGSDKKLPEYDTMFNILESESRPKHKRWNRKNLRWWVDQIFMSSIVAEYYKKYSRLNIKDKVFFEFNNNTIGLFNCDRYNRINPTPGEVNKFKGKNIYIIHLKLGGREIIKSFLKAIGD